MRSIKRIVSSFQGMRVMEPKRMKTNSPAKRVDIIHNAELFTHVKDEAASNPKSEPGADNASSKSSDEDDEEDGDFVPVLKPKGKNVPNAMRGKKCSPKGKRDAGYVFCPLPH